MAVQLYALSGVARSGATRSNYHSPNLFIALDGQQVAIARTDDATGVLWASVSITDVLNATPNTARMTTRGFVPSVGDDVVITLGSINNLAREFAGTVLQMAQADALDPDVTVGHVQLYAISAIDYTWGLDKRKVLAQYTSTTVGDVAAALLPSGYTLSIDADIAAVEIDQISFTEQDVTACFSQLMTRAGGDWRCTYHKVIRMFFEDTTETPPVSLTAAHRTLRGFRIAYDLSQVVTRVRGEGGGTNAAADVSVGETILPVTNAGWYPSAASVADGVYTVTTGYVKSGAQRVSYATVDLAGDGTLVGPGASPPGAPALALSDGSGLGLGDYTYAYTYVTVGESIPSPLAMITTGVYAAPSTALGPGDAHYGSGMTDGTHDYVVTFTTSSGETTPGPISTAITVGSMPTPSAPSVTTEAGAGPDNGDHYWAVTYYNNAGETTPGGNSNVVTLVDPDSSLGNHACIVALPSAPPSPGFGSVGRRVYRTAAGGSQLKYVGEVSDPTATTFRDTIRDSSLGANAPVSNTATVNQAFLHSIPIGSGAVTGRKLYRRFNSSGTFKLLTTLANNSATSYTDTTANASLGANAPTTNTAELRRVAVSGIGIGPSGTTGRKVYRTIVGGSQLKLLATIANNTTTTYADSTADGSLGANAPTSDTSGLTQPTGQVLAGETSVIVAGTGAFSTSGGWAVIGNGQQVIRYAGISGSSLIGIPVSGNGAIVATISYNSTITASPCLRGVPASGSGSILYPILKGDDVNLFVQVDDLSAQTALAALIGGDGIQEDSLQDRRLSSTETILRAEAQIALKRDVEVAISFTSRDLNAASGRMQDVNIAAPVSASGSFMLQQVTISNFLPTVMPLRAGQASTTRFTFAELLRMISTKGPQQ